MPKEGQIIRAIFWSAIIGVIVLASIPHPCGYPEPGNIRDLSHAKQIYLGLKMYAGDHDGKFPSLLPDGSSITTANQAYRALISDYIQKETIFYSKGSAWTPREPDNDIEGDRKLAAGENGFAYVPNLSDTSGPDLPLVITGFLEGRPGVYGDDPSQKGGITKEHGVAFVSVDGSGRLLKGRKRDHPASVDQSLYPDRIHVEWSDESRFIVKRGGKDIFNPASEWLAPNQVPLNPE